MNSVKHFLFAVIVIAVSVTSRAQTPQLINYQAIARSITGNILNGQTISVRLIIHTDSAAGPVEYQEVQIVTTNAYGLFSLQIGNGTTVGGAMSSIDWSNGAKYLQVEVDPTGASSYIDMGTQKLVSVPYSLYSENAATATTLSGGVPMSGDVSGTNTATDVIKLQGRAVSSVSPTTGQVLQWSGTAWVPMSVGTGTGDVTSITAGTGLSGGTITTSGTISMPNVGTAGSHGSATQIPVFTTDAQGRVTSVTNTSITATTYTAGAGITIAGSTINAKNTTALWNADQLQGNDISTVLPATGQVLKWDGTSWTPANDSVNTYTAGTALSLTGTTFSAQNATALWNADQLQGNNVSASTPSTGQVLQWSGSIWAPATPSLAWNVTGNTGTNPATNFVGTTDLNALRFRVNNQWAGELNPNTGNTSLGLNAGNAATTANSNIAIGTNALYSNTTVGNIIAIGDSALYSQNAGIQNMAVGSKALYSSTNGNNNTAIGTQSMYTNKSGYQNTATGLQTLYSNTTGAQNTAMGTVSLYSNTVGSDNVAYGSGSLQFNTTGDQNTAIGVQSLDQNTVGQENTAIGYTSMYFNTGSNNTSLGRASLYTNTTGSNNTAIGYAADVSSGGLSNATAVGNGAIVNASNKAVIGNTTVATIGGYQNWTNLSDGRFKTDIQEDVPGLDFILKLRPVTYHFEARKFEHFLGRPDSVIQKSSSSYDAAESQVRTGFIAQDVEKAAQETGYDFSGVHKPANDKDNYSLAYAEFTVPLVKAVQEQQKTISDLQKQVEVLMKRIDDLEKEKNTDNKK